MLYQKKAGDALVGHVVHSGMVAIRDINADGIKEIIYSLENDVAMHGDEALTSQVVGWDGESFYELVLPINEYGATLPPGSINANLEFQDTDGNGTTELIFPDNFQHHNCDEGPWRISRMIYMWDGKYYRYMWTDPGNPEYHFQAAFDGDYYAFIGFFDKSEELYMRAINDASLKAFDYREWAKAVWGANLCSDTGYTEPDELQRITAYARFRLLELQVYLQKMSDAEIEWQYLVNNYLVSAPGYRYASLANTFWEAYRADNNMEDACLAVKKEANQNQKDVFDPLATYGWGNNVPTLDTICPFTVKDNG